MYDKNNEKYNEFELKLILESEKKHQYRENHKLIIWQWFLSNIPSMTRMPKKNHWTISTNKIL